jgi:hypothetical protein
MKTISRGLLAATIAAVCVVPAAAKGPTVMLSVTGPALRHAVDIKDAQLLAASSVYEGAFISSPAAAPPGRLPRYTIAFHVEAPAWMRRPADVKYVVGYAADPNTGGGFVYIPARCEPGYAINAGTIERAGSEGRWFRADGQWASALNRYLSTRR